MERSIVELKDKYQGHDVFIVASGPTAGFIAPEFFDNKVAIGVNEAWMRFPNLDYLVRKEALRSVTAYASGIPLILSRYNCGVLQYEQNILEGEADYYIFEHEDNKLDRVDLSIIGGEKIVVSWSTITSAMHIAAHMGAANIIMVGHDCGTIDGQPNMPGYPPSPIADEQGYINWLARIEPQSIMVRERLHEVYGCRIYSLNPWINVGLEGHKYGRR